MRSDRTLNDIVSADTVQLAVRFLHFEEDNFIKQVDFLNLNPKRDFRNADLVGVNFSNSDLAGFDFTGSDLRGATGINVKWDHTTIFRGADTDGSVFAQQLAQEAAFAANPELAERVRRLNRNHWANTVLGVADLLDVKKNPDPDALVIAKALFAETRSLSVRSNILYFMSPVIDDREQHKAFIYSTLNRFNTETSVLKSALRTLTALYIRDVGALNILVGYLDHADQSIRNIALQGILSSPYFFQANESILRYVTACGDSMLRRQFVGRAARKMGHDYEIAATDTVISNFIDFVVPITRRDLERKAENNLRRDKYQRMTANAPRFGPDLEGSLKIPETEIQELADTYENALHDLRYQFKIPLKFEDEPREASAMKEGDSHGPLHFENSASSPSLGLC